MRRAARMGKKRKQADRSGDGGAEKASGSGASGGGGGEKKKRKKKSKKKSASAGPASSASEPGASGPREEDVRRGLAFDVCSGCVWTVRVDASREALRACAPAQCSARPALGAARTIC